MRSAILVVLILGLMIAIGNAASIALVHDQTVSLPNLNAPQTYTSFENLFNTALPDLLLYNDSEIVVYSLSGEIDIFRTAFDDPDAANGKAVLADINNDDIHELLTVEIENWMNYYWDGTSCNTLVRAYDFSDDPPLYGELYLETACLGAICDFYAISANIYAGDIDMDGVDELLLSSDRIECYEIGPFHYQNVYGSTSAIGSYPYDTLWATDFVIGQVFPTVVVDNSRLTILRNYSSGSFGEYGTDRDMSGSTRQYLVVDSVGKVTAAIPFVHELTCATGNQTKYAAQNNGALGDFLGDGGYQFISYSRMYEICRDFDSDSLLYYNEFLTLAMYQIVADSVLPVVWSQEMSAYNYDSFVIDPRFPGYFLALSSDAVALFRSADGHLLTEVDRPAGDLRWCDKFGDGELRLAAITDSYIDFYQLDISTGINDADDLSELPKNFALHQPYPNPFNASVSIALDIPTRSELTLEVYNTLGQSVATLHDGAITAGKKTFDWQADRFASGVYFVKASTSENTQTVKTVLLK